MIGLDTNVVVRHLVHDDPNQSKAATRAFAGLTPGEPGLLTTVVLIETYWVLTRGYKLAVADVVSALGALCGFGLDGVSVPDVRVPLASVVGVEIATWQGHFYGERRGPLRPMLCRC